VIGGVYSALPSATAPVVKNIKTVSQYETFAQAFGVL
jgi:hypothetical protein